MIVVGGVYSEYCYYPTSHQVFGSGGRAAAVLTTLGVKDTQLIACAPISDHSAVGAALAPYNFDFELVPSSALYEFSYTHPLSEPSLAPYPPERIHFPKTVRANCVLVFGMLEGLPRVEASRVVYDPQSESDLISPTSFISRCDELALVLNERELRAVTKQADLLEGAKALLGSHQISVVVIKRGPFGCLVVDSSGSNFVPVFPTDQVFKIGSGDVFSASFAKFWGADRMSAVDSAINASRCTSLYCETASIDEITRFFEFARYPKDKTKEPIIYLAGPFFSLGQRFLVEEARTALHSLGVKVFSPMHDVGFELSPDAIAKEDLNGLESCTAVLALIDGLDSGTIFEIGYARARSMPVVMYGENILDGDLTMLLGTDCFHSTDFCSAIYNSVWAGM